MKENGKTQSRHTQSNSAENWNDRDTHTHTQKKDRMLKIWIELQMIFSHILHEIRIMINEQWTYWIRIKAEQIR